MCIPVCVYAHECNPWGDQKRTLDTLGSWELYDVDTGPLGEQEELLTADPTLQSKNI